MTPKKAHLGQRVRPSKQAQLGPQPAPEKRRISWRLGDADLNGPYAWPAISETELRHVVAILHEIDKKPWDQVLGDGMGEIKAIPRSHLARAANQRLVSIERDDHEYLHRIRVGGAPRLWGIRQGDDVFHILWWDPLHEVCPSEKKRT